jgi:hypothetical protein
MEVHVKRIILLAAAAGAVAAGTLLATAGSSSAQSSSLPVITVAMDGKSITVGGALQSGGVDVRSTTTSEASGQPAFFRLNPGVTPAQALAAAAAARGNLDPNSLNPFGSIVFNAEADKGTSDVQTTLQPGNYVALDLAPSQSSNVRPPFSTFTITQAAQPATLPTPKATVRAIEFGFRGPSRLHRGDLVRFENDGFLYHMIVATEAKNAKAAKRIVKLLKAGKDNKAGRLAIGGYGFAGPISTGSYQQFVITQKPGVWVLACFMDTQDHREHTQLGMERIIRIVR